MKKFRLLMIFVICFGIGALTACSHFKSGGKKAESTEATGLGEQENFADENSPNRLKAPFNQTYHFDFDKYDVKAEDTASVEAQANYLAAHADAKVRLEGNADERGSREYNIALGWKRVRAVVTVLKQQGVKDAQIAMVSYGKEKPVALGHDENSYGQNRRVDLIYEAK